MHEDFHSDGHSTPVVVVNTFLAWPPTTPCLVSLLRLVSHRLCQLRSHLSYLIFCSINVMIGGLLSPRPAPQLRSLDHIHQQCDLFTLRSLSTYHDVDFGLTVMSYAPAAF